MSDDAKTELAEADAVGAQPETKYVAVAVEKEVAMPKLPLDELIAWMDGYKPPVDAYATIKSKTGKVLFVDSSRFAADESWWFVGDIHGDLRSLSAIISHIRSHDLGPNRIVFLGDIFDRNLLDGGFETVCAFLTLLHDAGDRVLWLAGNHDAILTFDESSGRFKISTNRSEFAEYLNRHPELHEFGRKLIALVARLPLAAYFSCGIVASHGGVPHTDVIDGLKTIDDLESVDCSNDYTWGRMTSAKFKFPDRTSRGHELGFSDFNKSCGKIAALSSEAGFAVDARGIVCGHQHLFTDGIGYLRFARYNEYPPSVCLYSSFALEPAAAWGTKRRFAVPCALHLVAGRYEICGFEPTSDSPLYSELMAEWQARFDAEKNAQEVGPGD